MTQAKTGFDISELEVKDQPITFDVPLIFDDEGEVQSGFRIVGKNSDEYQSEEKAIRIEGVQKAGRRKSAIDTSTEQGATMLVNILSKNEKRMAQAVIVDWFGFTKNGESIPFDKSVLGQMLDKYPTWAAKVNAALENDANFLKA